jgi:chemotaxis protein MotB
MKKYISIKNDNLESVSYWLSIGDLMASILIIFILLFVFQIQHVNNELKKKEDVIESLTSVKNKIIAKLRSEFEKEDMKIDIDSQTGAIKLDEQILFNSGDFKLKDEGKEYLKIFIPKYVKIIIGDEEIKNEISQIIVEGHTDDVGSYIYNMNLSQQRAFEVLRYIYNEMNEFPCKSELQNYITANGRSKIQLIKNSDGTVNKEKSRRVEFKFKLKEEEVILKIKEQITGEKNEI